MDPSQALMYFAVIVGSAVVIKIAYQAMFVVYIVAFPILYLYAVQKCPPIDSFDAKKELKRVMRGYHLPEDDPKKPKGLIGETLARVQASAAAEVAMAPGYEITIYVSKMWQLSNNSHHVNNCGTDIDHSIIKDIIGACKIVVLRVPTIARDCYWVGAFGQWYYLLARDLADETKID